MPSEYEQIQAGERIQAFLADPAVDGALEKLESRYVREWKASQNVDERNALHAKVCVLEDLKLELRAIVNTGTRAKVESERKARSTQQNRQRAR